MVNFLENSDLEAAKYVIGQPYVFSLRYVMHVYVVRVRARVCICVRRVGCVW